MTLCHSRSIVSIVTVPFCIISLICKTLDLYEKVGVVGRYSAELLYVLITVYYEVI